MGKRLLMFPQYQLAECLPPFVGRELQVVNQAGETYHGRLESYADGQFRLKDMLGRKHSFTLKEVQEVMLDEEHPNN